MLSLLSLNAGGVPWLSRKRARRIRHLIRGVGFDIVALQEIWSFWDPRRVRPRGYRVTRGPFLSGLAILSREKPLEVRCLTYKATSIQKGDIFARKGALLCRFAWGWAVTTHLDSGGAAADFHARQHQIDRLIEHLPERSPLILAGDLNLAEHRPADHAMLTQLIAERGLEISVRDGVDFILTRELEVRHGRVRPETNLSDHRALELIA